MPYFLRRGAVFVLEGAGAVMLLLVVDVVEVGIQVRWTDGKGTVAALPCKGGQRGRLGFEPFGGRCFQFLDELGHGDGPRQTHGEMHMVSHASDAETFAIHIAGDRREIGVKRGPHRGIEPLDERRRSRCRG